MADQGNAVNAQWVGPSGYQLWDGTSLEPGDIVLDVGYDEATSNPYWQVVGSVPKGTDPVGSAAANRDDPSFGTEQGGGATGRPELAEDTVVEEKPPAKSKGSDS